MRDELVDTIEAELRAAMNDEAHIAVVRDSIHRAIGVSDRFLQGLYDYVEKIGEAMRASKDAHTTIATYSPSAAAEIGRFRDKVREKIETVYGLIDDHAGEIQ